MPIAPHLRVTPWNTADFSLPFSQLHKVNLHVDLSCVQAGSDLTSRYELTLVFFLQILIIIMRQQPSEKASQYILKTHIIS